MGTAKNNQFFFGMSNRSFRKSFDSKGAKRPINRKVAKKSKIAYSPNRNCLRYSIGTMLCGDKILKQVQEVGRVVQEVKDGTGGGGRLLSLPI